MSNKIRNKSGRVSRKVGNLCAGITHNWQIVLIFGVLMHAIDVCNGHGRLIEPPSRSTAWRYGFKTPANYNDNELFCGGLARQQRNGGKCGVCGDPWDVPQPRPNEYGGKYGLGVIVRKYNLGSVMTIRVQLTASHKGYFEFRLCPNVQAKQGCLDKHLLKLVGGSPNKPQPRDLKTRFYPRFGSRIYEIKARLPADLKCDHCVLQWRYVAGNNWGRCADGTEAIGCGPQEEFRACSDIAIGKNTRSAIKPIQQRTNLVSLLRQTYNSWGRTASRVTQWINTNFNRHYRY